MVGEVDVEMVEKGRLGVLPVLWFIRVEAGARVEAGEQREEIFSSEAYIGELRLTRRPLSRGDRMLDESSSSYSERSSSMPRFIVSSVRIVSMD